MSKFPPRRILTRESRLERAALAFTDQRPIDPNDKHDTRDEYLSFAEHEHLLAIERERSKRLAEALEEIGKLDLVNADGLAWRHQVIAREALEAYRKDGGETWT